MKVAPRVTNRQIDRYIRFFSRTSKIVDLEYSMRLDHIEWSRWSWRIKHSLDRTLRNLDRASKLRKLIKLLNHTDDPAYQSAVERQLTILCAKDLFV
jgi:hypothetical protein